MVFRTTPAKDLIRDGFDKEKVKELHDKLGHKLSYFGLPGALLLDIRSWREYLLFVTAVERDNDLLRHRMLSCAFKNGVADRLQILLGDIDDVLLNWKDRNGDVPSRTAYDIINLDYEGGMVYKDLKGDSKRMMAIRKMIERQASSRRDHLILLTVNTRNRDSNEFDTALRDIQDELSDYGIQAPEMEWYVDQGYDLKLKVYVPYQFELIAANNRFLAKYYPPISYLGSSNVRMVHFAIEMQCEQSRAGRPKGRSLRHLVNIPLFEVRKNKLVKVPMEIVAREAK